MNLILYTGLPVITINLKKSDVIKGQATRLQCKARCYIGKYHWQKNFNSTWVTVSNMSSYTTKTTLTVGQHKYRCIIKSKAGITGFNVATVNVYGMYLYKHSLAYNLIMVCRSSYHQIKV